MTAERDGKSRRGQPDLLATLPAERPPASQPAPGIDPALFEELLATVHDLREQVAGLRKAESAERPAPGDDAAAAQIGKIKETVAELTAEVRRQNAELSSIGNKLKAARPADAPADDAAAAVADHMRRIEDAAAKAAAERIDGGLESTADRVMAGIEGAVTRIESNLKATRTHVTLQSRQANPILEDIRTQTAGPRFGLRTVLVWFLVFVLGMVLESHIHLFYRWL